MRWQGGPRLFYATPSGARLEVAFRTSEPMRWTWDIGTGSVHAHAKRTYKTASGAKRACERVARRLGVC